MDFREKIDKLLEIKGVKLWKLAELSKLGNTLEKAYELNREMRESTTDRFIQNLSINKEWWETQKGEVFTENTTPVQQSANNKQNGMTTKETFYQDLIENNEEYSLLPRAVLKDYKIVPDKIIDVIIASNENEKKALKESKDLEIDSLMKKYELIIQGLENKAKRLEGEKEELAKEKNALEAEIAGLRRQIPANK